MLSQNTDLLIRAVLQFNSGIFIKKKIQPGRLNDTIDQFQILLVNNLSAYTDN